MFYFKGAVIMTTSAIVGVHSPECGINLLGELDIRELLTERVVITDTKGFSHLPANAKYELCIVIHPEHTVPFFGWYFDFLNVFYAHLIYGVSRRSNILIVTSMDEAVEVAREIEEKGHIDIFLFGSTTFLVQYAHMFDDVYIIEQAEQHPSKAGSGYSSGLPLIWGRSAWQIWESFRRFEDPLLGRSHLEIRGTHFRKVGRRNAEFEGKGLVFAASR